METNAMEIDRRVMKELQKINEQLQEEKLPMIRAKFADELKR